MTAEPEARPAGRHWTKTEDTRRQVLAAALEVFLEKGYSQAGISDVVERADSSVGSVYHHFGGKAELFTALWERHAANMAGRAAAGVSAAREKGVDDPIELFEAGSAAYLDGVWKERAAASIFYAGDGPPGFETARRERNQEWIKRNLQVLAIGKKTEERLMGAVLTAIMGEAARMILKSHSAREAKKIAIHAIGMARAVWETA